MIFWGGMWVLVVLIPDHCLSFLCSFIFSGFAIIPKCPHAWYPNTNDPTSTSCYLITQKIKRSWQDAQTFCEYMDGSLFKIDSVSERVSLSQLRKIMF